MVSDEELLGLLLLGIASYLVVMVCVLLADVDIRQLIYQKLLSWSSSETSEKIAHIVAINKIESYEVESYCTICFSLSTSRCNMCGVVAYCSTKCQTDHWKQGHSGECLSMAKAKRRKMDGQVHCTDEMVKPFKDARKSIDQQTSNFEHFTFNHQHSTAISKQEKQTNPENLTESKKEIPQSKSSKMCDEECIAKHSFAICGSLSRECYSKCKISIYCSEHNQEYKWQNDHKEPRIVDDDLSTKKASNLKPSDTSNARNFGATYVQDKRVSTATNSKHEIKAKTSDHFGTTNRDPIFARNLSSGSSYSSLGSWSVGISESDAVSSLHDLDFD